jgi:hypothetical protein
MDCKNSSHLLNAYLDDALSWQEAGRVEEHLRTCPHCAGEYDQLKSLKRLMRSLRRLEPPEYLVLQMKIEASKLENRPFILQRIFSRIDRVLRPIAIPAFSGVVLTFLCFVVLWSTFLPGAGLSVSERDVPLNLFTEPRASSLYMSQFVQLEKLRSVEEPIMVETHVNNDGRVVDYQILSGPRDQATVRSLNQFLFFEVYINPATMFGRPVASKLTLSLSWYLIANNHIDVMG